MRDWNLWKLHINLTPQNYPFSVVLKELKNSISQKTYQVDIRREAKFCCAHKKYHSKISKTMGLLCRFQLILQRSSLLTIYKTFIRSQSDFAVVICNQAYNSSFHEKLEPLQYNACLAITGAIKRISPEKLYQELALESLKSRRWFRNFVIFIRY